MMGGTGLPLGLTPAVRALLIATVLAFVIQQRVDARSARLFSMTFGLSLKGLLRGDLWTPFSYVFLHWNVWHILVNMLVLVVMGRQMELVLGARRFTWLYLLTGAAGGLGWLAVSGWQGRYCVGASGAVLGVMGTFAALFPHKRITLLLFFVLPLTMSARTLIFGFGVVTLVAMIVGAGEGQVAHAAHLAGGVAGYVYGRWLLARGRGRGGAKARGSGSGQSVLRGPWSAPPPVAPPESTDVDTILDKVKREGLGSLTNNEREALERASRDKDTRGRSGVP